MRRKRTMRSWKIVGKISDGVKRENENKLLTDKLFVPSIQAKDIFIGQANKKGLILHNSNDEILPRKYNATLDYSMEQVKLREVFSYLNSDSPWSIPLYDSQNKIIKLFSSHVMSINFDYNVKTWNRVNLYDKDGKHKAYVKYGCSITIDDFKDCIAVKEGKVIGVIVGETVMDITDKIYTPFYITPDKKYNLEDSYNKNMYEIYEEEELDLNSSNMRKILYNKGFDYNGIHYRRYKRASGASRKGKCLFIDTKLYLQMREWELMNLKVNNNSIDLAGEEAYISLTLSGCNQEIIHINKDEILIVDEKIDSFRSHCIGVFNENNALFAEEKDVDINNNLFDGEALIESNLCNGYGKYGMCLLREQMCKTAAFATRIQKFFADRNITAVSQLNGFTLATDIRQIKLILNPTCIKYLKFDKSAQKFENWLNTIKGDFYVVKHEHTSFFNNKLVHAHYQLINTLELSYSKMEELLKPSFDYLNKVNTDPIVFKNHINIHINMDDSDLNCMTLDKLLKINDKAYYSSYCKGIKEKIRKSLRKSLKNGHVLIHGNYSVLFGNPLHYLYHAIGEYDKCNEFTGAQCMTVNKNFKNEKVVLCRSPHVAAGNLTLLDNVYVSEIDEYFVLTDNIICLNAIGENILERLSGADYDSDSAIITNEKIIVDAAEKNYDKFGVPTNLVKPNGTNEYHYTMDDLSRLDSSIMEQSSQIGEIINFSQVLQSLMWDQIHNSDLVSNLIKDCAILDVMSCICIDSAKKDYSNIDLKEELEKLQTKYKKWLVNKEGHVTKPTFFKQIDELKNYKKDQDRYKYYNTSMCHLVKIVNKFRCDSVEEDYTLADILTINIPCRKDNISKNQIKDIIQSALESKRIINKIMEKKNENFYEDYLTTVNTFYEYVFSLKINVTTAYKIIRLLDTNNPNIKMIKRLITTAIFNHDIIKSLIGFIDNDYHELEQISDSEITVADYIFYGIGYKKIFKRY